MPKTFGDVMKEAIACTTKEEAKALVEREVKQLQAEHGKSEEEARFVTLRNIGYGSGYYDQETSARLLNLFDTTHPIFGKGYPTPDESWMTTVRRLRNALDRGPKK